MYGIYKESWSPSRSLFHSCLCCLFTTYSWAGAAPPKRKPSADDKSLWEAGWWALRFTTCKSACLLSSYWWRNGPRETSAKSPGYWGATLQSFGKTAWCSPRVNKPWKGKEYFLNRKTENWAKYLILILQHDENPYRKRNTKNITWSSYYYLHILTLQMLYVGLRLEHSSC